MIRTRTMAGLASLGAAAVLLAACGGSSTATGSSSAEASAPAAASSSAPEGNESASAAASAGTPLYLVDGNMSNALGEKLPAGTLTGVKGTIPGAENTQDFKDALLALDPELKDFTYAPESYDATTLIALAAAKSKSDVGADMAKAMVEITNGTEICNDFAGCIELLNQGKDIDYNGRSGAVNFSPNGDPTVASVGVYQFGPDNTILPDVAFEQGEYSSGEAPTPIDAKPQTGANDKTLTIGTLLPVTGNLAFLGPPMIDGARLAIQDIEAAGGVPGFDKVVLEEGDSGDTSTNTAQQTVKRLKAKGIDALLGAASSGVSLSVIDSIVNDGILMVSPSNTSPAFTTAPDKGLYFRTAPSDVLQGAFLGSLILQDGYTKVAIMSLQDSYGDGLNANIAQAITDGGGEVVANVVYDPKATDFAADVATVKAAGPEAIVLVGFDESAQVIQELVKQGIGPNTIG